MTGRPRHFRVDPWEKLRQLTPARIALGRAGGSVPTGELLDFAMAHAAARDAVHEILDANALMGELKDLGLTCLLLQSQATNRQIYLQRPDLGRRLSAPSRAMLVGTRGAECDVCLIVSDGLSAPAAQSQAAPLLRKLLPMLRASSISVGPISIVTQARVAVEDEIGELLGAKVALNLIGERPGLGTSHSLGAYLVFGPSQGKSDAERNCVSNIRPGGLSAESAADALHYLITRSLHRRISGVALKDERPILGATESSQALEGREPPR